MLSPILFNVVMEGIIRRVMDHLKKKVTAYLFADDIMIWDGNEEEVQEQ